MMDVVMMPALMVSNVCLNSNKLVNLHNARSEIQIDCSG